MDIAKIAALLDPFLEQSLPPSKLDQISIYIDLLLRWNAHINLTAIRHPEEIVTRHFGESFCLASHLFPNLSHPERSRAIREADGEAQSKDPYSVPPRVLDIGSGAGFPALPLKLWAPHIHLTLIESNHKKAAFLREVARTLTLTDINVINDRTEILAARPDSPRAEVVTLRAVERFKTILPQALTFLAPDATLAVLIGIAQVPSLTTLTTLKWHPPIPIPQSHTRVLSIGARM
jgi:16S rRNA (guanine527-N7)-methyltransferase